MEILNEFYSREEQFGEVNRYDFIQKSSFVTLTKPLLDAIANYLKGNKVLEVMSGSGALAKELKDRGIDIIATDNFTRDKNFWDEFWTDIEEIDALEAIDKYSDRDILLMAWPPYEDDIALKCVKKANMDIIYVGETKHGCTANDEFFEQVNLKPIKEINKEYDTWFGIHDKFYEVELNTQT